MLFKFAETGAVTSFLSLETGLFRPNEQDILQKQIFYETFPKFFFFFFYGVNLKVKSTTQGKTKILLKLSYTLQNNINCSIKNL